MAEQKVSKKAGEILIFLIIGFVIAGFFTSLGAESDARWLKVLNHGYSFGMTEPCIIDLGVMVLTFGLNVKITLGSLIGCIVTAVIYKKFIE